MKKILVLLFAMVYFFVQQKETKAQQDPLFSQYMFNKLLLNPAYAGSKEVLALDVLDRYQWVGIDDAPRTFTFAAHTALRNRKIGIGVYVYKDQLGPLNNQGIMGSYAYRIIMKKGILSFGIQAGVKLFDYTWLDEYLQDPDYVFQFSDVKRISPDANFGIQYQTNNFFAGISSKQLFQNEYGRVEVEGKSTYTRLTRHFYGYTGYAFDISERVALKPSILIKYVKNAPPQLDANLSIVYNDKYWAGFSYRTENAVIVLAELKLTNYLRVGYSFDAYLNQLKGYGTHEFRIGLDFELFQSRMLTPRYFL